MLCRIALHGLARVGKDEVGNVLTRRFGLVRVALGDLIKRQLDSLVLKHLGFSAFTNEDHQKRQIREVLVRWGYANYENLLAEFMHDLPGRCVSTRIFRLEECLAWRDKGGLTFEVQRPGTMPAEPMEMHELNRCRAADMIDGVIVNDGSLLALSNATTNLMLARGYRDILKVNTDSAADVL